MSENASKFEELNEEFKAEYVKAQNGNKAAATRARKALLEMGKLSKVLRVEIQEKKLQG